MDRIHVDLRWPNPANDPCLSTLLLLRIDKPIVLRVSGVLAGEMIQVVLGLILGEFHKAANLNPAAVIPWIDYQ